MSDYGLSGSTSTVSKGNSAQRKNQQDRGRRFSGASWRKRKGAKTSIDKNAKAKARDLRRVLLKKKEGLSAEAVDRLQNQIASLERSAQHSKKEEKRKHFIIRRKKLYDKIKFYEGQKVRRKIRSTRRVLSALLKKRREGSGLSVEEIAGLDAQIASHQEVLRQHLDDLTYIVRYPPDEAYVALFPSGGSVSADTQRKREEIRARIREQILGERLENGKEDDGGGIHEDSFFLARPASELAYTAKELRVAATSEVDDKDATATFVQAPDLVDTAHSCWAGRGRPPVVLPGGARDQQRRGRLNGQVGRAGRSRQSVARTAPSESPKTGGPGWTVGTPDGASVPASRQEKLKRGSYHETGKANKTRAGHRGTENGLDDATVLGKAGERTHSISSGKSCLRIGLSKSVGAGKHTIFEDDSD